MKIKEILSQSRRDFTATILCENCGNIETMKNGYDDRYFHDNVMPAKKCAVCNLSRNDIIAEMQAPTPTKYAEWETV